MACTRGFCQCPTGADFGGTPMKEHVKFQRRMAIEIFPVTILLALQYGALVAIPTVLYRTAPEALILEICGLGVGVAFVIEALLGPIPGRLSTATPSGFVTWNAAKWIMIVGWIASWIGVLLGQGTYASQIGTTSQSHLTAIFTPFYFWPLIGVAMSLWLRRESSISDRRAWIVIGINVVLELALSVDKAIVAPLFSFLLAIAFLAVITRMIRLRLIVVGLIVVTFAWPVLYNFRNERRISLGENVVAAQLQNAGQRLRLDLEMAQMEDVLGYTTNIGQPTFRTLIETGLIPRFLDPSRASVNTGSGFSVATGGASTSSDTATTFGLAYIEQRWAGVIAFSVSVAIFTAIAVRRRGAWALAMIGLVVQQAIWIEAAYPDFVAAMLQAIISLLVAVVFSVFFHRQLGKIDGQAESLDPLSWSVKRSGRT